MRGRQDVYKRQYPLIEEESMEVRGRNLVTGLPKTVTVTSSETEEALRETSGKIVEAVVSVLEQTPPEPVSYTHLDSSDRAFRSGSRSASGRRSD